MTKQEYEAAVKYAMDNDRPPWLDIAIHQAKNNYIASLEAEIAKLQADNRSLVEQVNQMAMMIEHKMSNIVNDKSHFGLEAVKYKDDVFSWVETMFEKEKKAKDALMKSDVMLVDKAGFLALCNLMLKISKDIEKLQGENHE